MSCLFCFCLFSLASMVGLHLQGFLLTILLLQRYSILTLLFYCIFIILQLSFSYSISVVFWIPLSDCSIILTFDILFIFIHFSYPLNFFNFSFDILFFTSRHSVTVVFGWYFISFSFASFNFFYFSFDILFLFLQFLPLYIHTFIEIPPFYHEQWAPNYPEAVQLRYNGATYPIQLQQH